MPVVSKAGTGKLLDWTAEREITADLELIGSFAARAKNFSRSFAQRAKVAMKRCSSSSELMRCMSSVNSSIC